MSATQPESSRELAVVDALEAIDAIPDGDQLIEVRVWQFAEGATRHAGMWGWYVRMSHEVGPGSSGKGDGKQNRRLAKGMLIHGKNEWPPR